MTLTVEPLPAAARIAALAQARWMSRSGQARIIRQATGLGLKAVGEAIGATTSTVYRWETGACRPTGDAALRWLRLLDDLRELAS